MHMSYYIYESSGDTKVTKIQLHLPGSPSLVGVTGSQHRMTSGKPG